MTSDAGATGVVARPSWFMRNWKWFVPLSVIVLAAAVVGAIVLFIALLMASLRQAEPYRVGVEIAQTHVGLRELIGEPIETGRFFTGQMSTNRGIGRADFRIPVIGPDGRGVLVIDAQRPSGAEWEYMILRVEIFGEPTVIDLRGKLPQ